MRSRTKYSDAENITYNNVYYRQTTNGVLTAGPTLQAAKTMRSRHGYEVMFDDPTPGRGVKSVSHLKIKGEVNPTTYSSYGNGAPLNVCEGTGAVWVNWWGELGGPSILERNRTAQPIVTSYPKSEAQQVADAVHDFYSNNETDNLLNAIESPQLLAGLTSLKSSVSSPSVVRNITNSLLIKAGGGLIPLFGPKGSSAVERARRSGLAKLGKNLFGRYGKRVSSVYLAYSFGIAPLLSDMRKIKNAVPTLRRALEKTQRTAGKTVSVHRYMTGSCIYKDSATNVDLGSSYRHTDWAKWKLSSGAPRRTVTVRGIQNQKFSTPALAELDYMLSRFGATGPLDLAWELIPFSFVVDWFVDLRNITDRLDNLLTGSNKKIMDVCVSEKYDAQSLLIWDHVPNNNNYQDASTLLYTEYETYYRRDPVTDYNIVGLSGKFGKKQASLLAALIHQQVANWLVKR